MSNCSKRPDREAVTNPHFISTPLRWLPALIAAVLFAVALPARALEADEWYLQVYAIIEQADTLNTSGQTEKAKAKYLEAEKALKNLRQNYPTYNAKLVTTRLTYLSGKIATLSQPPPAPADVTDENKASAPAAKAVVPGQPQVKLLDAGAEPRKAFRLQAKLMDIQKAKIAVKISMGINAPEMPGEMMKMPAISMKAAITTKSISAEGDVNYEVVIEEVDVLTEPGVAPQIAEGMKQSLAGVKGLVVNGTLTDRYLSKKVEVKIPPGTDAQTREGMEQMKEAFANTEFVLPEEAIGVGAKWEVKAKTKEQGMTIDQTTRHELVSIEGDSLVTKSSTTQSAANQKISNPIMPTLKVDMTKMTGTATGTATVDLAKVLPSKATSDERVEINMAVNSGGKKQVMTMKTETRSTLETE